ncbi:MAG: GTP-binding protein [Clostridiales bacterium]|nr:GTP-binding protein [Clostridiales bacterium]
MKINIISGFLGAGKTTLIQKLLSGSIKNEKVVLLENEYGDVSVDGSFMKDAGITVTELSNGCICCSLVGDLHAAIDEIIEKYSPDRLLVEPSGVGKLSEIVAAVEKAKERHADLAVSGCATVVDAKKCKMHMRAFGEFYQDQVKTADTVIFSRTQLMDAAQVEAARQLMLQCHPGVRIITTPWDDLSSDAMLEVIESGRPIISREEMEHHHHHHDEHCTCGCHGHHDHHHHDHEEHCDCHEHHDHHHHDHEEHCDCHEHHDHHHHDHEEHCDCHEHHDHHHHDHEEHCDCHEHHEHHHHEHDEHCTCGCHDHDHHGHHHHGHDADEVFVSIGAETARRYEQAEIQGMLDQLENEEKFGHVLRAKGVLQSGDGSWFQFDYVPGESQIRPGSADYTGRLCIIGAHLKEQAVRELFAI